MPSSACNTELVLLARINRLPAETKVVLQAASIPGREVSFFFFFNDTATTEIYTLSLHDALPILVGERDKVFNHLRRERLEQRQDLRSEEHTSELQSPTNLVCRLLLEKKKKK